MSNLDQSTRKKIIVLGVSGMLGHKVFEVLSLDKKFDVWGTVTFKEKYQVYFSEILTSRLIGGVFADKIGTVEKVCEEIRPDWIINCIGIITQNEKSSDQVIMIQLNALFPHQIAQIAEKIGSRVLTISTDCVFNGRKGEPYLESELPNNPEVYGLSKYLGELRYGNNITLRTSIIGHELNSNLSLIDWFLNDQRVEVPGYTNAIFSGLTTLELAKFISKYVLLNNQLKGLYHLSAEPISKYDLLKIVADEYLKKVILIPNNKVSINRSLNSDRLRELTGYQPPVWRKLISQMHKDYLLSSFYSNKREKHGK